MCKLETQLEIYDEPMIESELNIRNQLQRAMISKRLLQNSSRKDDVEIENKVTKFETIGAYYPVMLCNKIAHIATVKLQLYQVPFLTQCTLTSIQYHYQVMFIQTYPS